MNAPDPEYGPEAHADPEWEARLRYWSRKLGRVRLGAEPVEEQLAKYRRATLVLTAVPAVVALIFVGLFTAFGRPGIGVVLSLVILGPIVAVAWLDHALLHARVSAYLREVRARRANCNGTTSGGA